MSHMSDRKDIQNECKDAFHNKTLRHFAFVCCSIQPTVSWTDWKSLRLKQSLVICLYPLYCSTNVLTGKCVGNNHDKLYSIKLFTSKFEELTNEELNIIRVLSIHVSYCLHQKPMWIFELVILSLWSWNFCCLFLWRWSLSWSFKTETFKHTSLESIRVLDRRCNTIPMFLISGTEVCTWLSDLNSGFD